MTILRVEQDGADFYDADQHVLIERIEAPFVRRNDWYSLEAAQEAAAEFSKRHPEAVFVAFGD
jgi:hypothetical protein